jgi:integrase
LRAGELAALQVDDVDWRRGEITICGNKLKQQAIERTARTGTPPGRYRPDDTLLAFLERL